MKKKLLTSALALVMAAGVILTPANVKAATVNEVEPNNTEDAASRINVGDVYQGEYGSYELYKGNGHKDDVDYIKVSLEAGKTYDLQMTNWTSFYEPTTCLVDMFSPDGTRHFVGFNFEYNEATGTDVYTFTANEGGDWLIKIWNYVDTNSKTEHYYNLAVTNNGAIMDTSDSASTDGVAIYRLYNSANGEHLYTTDANERDVLNSSAYPDWTYEGIGWTAPNSGTPVYRLYNPELLNHLYTTDTNEVNVLTSTTSWQLDNNGNPVFYSGGDKPIYRLYAAELNGMHHLTTDANEYNTLPTISSYVKEGVSFYAVK